MISARKLQRMAGASAGSGERMWMLLDLLDQWYRAKSDAEKREIWTRMLKIQSDNVFSIGLVAGVHHDLDRGVSPAKGRQDGCQPGSQCAARKPG